MIRAGLIPTLDEVFDNLGGRVTDAFSQFADYFYLAEWYGLGIVLAVALVAVAIFVPFKWPRAFMGGLLFAYALFLVGMQVMFNHERSRTKSLRDTIDELKAERRTTQRPGGWFNG